VTTTNPTSIRLHEALGFEEVGVYRRIGWKAGSWLDVMWLSLQLGPDTVETEQPTSPGQPTRLERPIEL
jgi:phosphinothricin acetyltransferase